MHLENYNYRPLIILYILLEITQGGIINTDDGTLLEDVDSAWTSEIMKVECWRRVWELCQVCAQPRAAAAAALSCSWEYGVVDTFGTLIPKGRLEGESQDTASEHISCRILGLWPLLWPLVSYPRRTETLPTEGTAAWHGGQRPYLTLNICVSHLQA